MTTPTIAVPRELLERITRRFSIRPHWDSMQQGAAIAELRALLTEQPQPSAAQSAPAGEREASMPTPDEIHQMAFEEGQPAENGDGYLFCAEEFDCFVQRLLDSIAAWQRTQSAGVPVATVVQDKSGDWYIDALQPSRFGEPGYLEEGTELFADAPAQPAAQGLCNCPAGSKPEPHKHAPNCPYRTGAAAHDQGEVQRLRAMIHAIFTTRDAWLAPGGRRWGLICDPKMTTEELLAEIAALAASTGQEV